MVRLPLDDNQHRSAQEWLDAVCVRAGGLGAACRGQVRDVSGTDGVLLEWSPERRAHVTIRGGDDAQPSRLVARTHFFGPASVAPHHLAWVNAALEDAQATWEDDGVVLEAWLDLGEGSPSRVPGWLQHVKACLDIVAPMLASTLVGPDAVEATSSPADAEAHPAAVLLDSLDEADRLWTEREEEMPVPPQSPEKQARAGQLRGRVDGVPRGLSRCATCGEFRGECGHPRDPDTLVDVLCRCQNTYRCTVCGQPKSRRQPMSWYYDERDGRLWYASYLAAMENVCACAQARRRQEQRRGDGQ